MGLDVILVGKSLETLLSAERSEMGLDKILEGRSSVRGLHAKQAAHGESVGDTLDMIDGRTQGGVAHGSRRTQGRVAAMDPHPPTRPEDGGGEV